MAFASPKLDAAKEFLKNNPTATLNEAKVAGHSIDSYYRAKRELGLVRKKKDAPAKTALVMVKPRRGRPPRASTSGPSLAELKLFIERVAADRDVPRALRFEAWELINP